MSIPKREADGISLRVLDHASGLMSIPEKEAGGISVNRLEFIIRL